MPELWDVYPESRRPGVLSKGEVYWGEAKKLQGQKPPRSFDIRHGATGCGVCPVGHVQFAFWFYVGLQLRNCLESWERLGVWTLEQRWDCESWQGLLKLDWMHLYYDMALSYGSQGVKGLHENGPHRLVCSNIWSLVGSYMGRIRTCGLLEGGMSLKVGFEISKDCYITILSSLCLYLQIKKWTLSCSYHYLVAPLSWILNL